MQNFIKLISQLICTRGLVHQVVKITVRAQWNNNNNEITTTMKQQQQWNNNQKSRTINLHQIDLSTDLHSGLGTTGCQEHNETTIQTTTTTTTTSMKQKYKWQLKSNSWAPNLQKNSSRVGSKYSNEVCKGQGGYFPPISVTLKSTNWPW